MWEYGVVHGVSPEKFSEVCTKHQSEGWSLFQADHYRIPAAPHRTLGAAQPMSRWDLIFRKSGGQSLAEVHMNSARDKLREVRDALSAVVDVMNDDGRKSALGRIGAEIDAFLFKGSSDDM